MTTHTILQPAGWVKPKGYANGVAAQGRFVFVGGQIGWNGQSRFETDDLVGQVRQTLQNIVDVLAEAGARPEHVTSLTWYLTNKKDYLGNLRRHRQGLPRGHGAQFPGDGRGRGHGPGRGPRQGRDPGHGRRADLT